MTNDTEPDRGDRARLMKEGSAPIALYDETPFKSPGITLHEHPPVPGSAPIALYHESLFKSPPIAVYPRPRSRKRMTNDDFGLCFVWLWIGVRTSIPGFGRPDFGWGRFFSIRNPQSAIRNGSFVIRHFERQSRLNGAL